MKLQRMVGLITLLMASLSAGAPAHSAAQISEDFYGRWMEEGEPCDTESESHSFEIYEDDFATGWGGTCKSIKMTLKGGMLIVKSQCPIEDTDSYDDINIRVKLLNASSAEITMIDEEGSRTGKYLKCPDLPDEGD